MSAAQRENPLLDGNTALLKRFGGSQTLRCDRHDCGEVILEAVLQLQQQELLQSLRILARLGIYAGLGNERCGVETRLRQQRAEPGVFRLEFPVASSRYCLLYTSPSPRDS